MPRYRHARAAPADHLADGERWPNGRLAADAPLEARHAQQVAKRLHFQMQGRTNKEVADDADITETALSELMRGRSWGTLPVLARLEEALNADLWCGRPHPEDRPASAENTQQARVSRPMGAR